MTQHIIDATEEPDLSDGQGLLRARTGARAARRPQRRPCQSGQDDGRTAARERQQSGAGAVVQVKFLGTYPKAGILRKSNMPNG